LGVNLGRPVVTNGNGDALFPNYFGEDLFTHVVVWRGGVVVSSLVTSTRSLYVESS